MDIGRSSGGNKLIESAFAAGKCTEVRVMVTAGPEEDVLAKFARSDFQAKTGINAVVETVSRDLWPSRAAREFTANQAEFDLVALNSSAGDPVWVGRGKSKDLRQVLSPDLIKNILPKLVEAATYNNKLVAVPQYWNTEMYFYRKDLFGEPKNQAEFKAKYGYDLAPPTTWDQLADIDEFFHRPPDLYGGWMSGVNWELASTIRRSSSALAAEPSTSKKTSCSPTARRASKRSRS